MSGAQAASGVVVASLLAGCAAGGLSPGEYTGSSQKSAGMAGRWVIAAPNAPPCGMEFTGAPDAKDGHIIPEGGCPARMFLSRRWRLTGTELVISDEEDNALAELKRNGPGFEGQSLAGVPVTLAR